MGAFIVGMMPSLHPCVLKEGNLTCHFFHQMLNKGLYLYMTERNAQPSRDPLLVAEFRK